MSTPAEYRQYAEECLLAMRVAVIPEVRAALAVMAQRWTELADRTEHGSHQPEADRISHGRQPDGHAGRAVNALIQRRNEAVPANALPAGNH
jgi:hypothetical protein